MTLRFSREVWLLDRSAVRHQTVIILARDRKLTQELCGGEEVRKHVRQEPPLSKALALARVNLMLDLLVLALLGFCLLQEKTNLFYFEMDKGNSQTAARTFLRA